MSLQLYPGFLWQPVLPLASRYKAVTLSDSHTLLQEHTHTHFCCFSGKKYDVKSAIQPYNVSIMGGFLATFLAHYLILSLHCSTLSPSGRCIIKNVITRLHWILIANVHAEDAAVCCFWLCEAAQDFCRAVQLIINDLLCRTHLFCVRACVCWGSTSGAR